MKLTVYAMAGPIGAGKTTLAKQIAKEKNAAFFSIDQLIKMLKQPLGSAQEYEKYYFGMRDAIANISLQFLNHGISVVFDFGGTDGHWGWLKALADSANAEVEIYNLVVPIEIRRERVRGRNSDPVAIFHFSDESFDSMPKESTPPDEVPGLKVIQIRGIT